jgi:ParB family chromosome partitioning protein
MDTTTDITATTPQLIAVSRLAKSPLNARRTVATLGMDELKASLLAHGLMQNLVVTDAGDGRFLVIAGARRLEAIRALQAEGKLPEDFAVACHVVSDEHALEMSLAENTVRLAMHPADQFEAFAALIDKGHSAAEVAERFGVEESLVLKRMKLARVAPELLAEYRSEGMTLECLMAFTVTDDHRRQLKLFKSLQGWQKDDPSAIRAALTEKTVEASSKLARFVGIEAYQAAGGPTRADLFGNEVYLEKPALLHKLAEQKLAAIRTELEAEGWSWIEVNPDRDFDAIHRCGRIKPLLVDAPAELIDLKSRLDAELEAIEEALDDSESDELLERQEAIHDRLLETEEKLAAHVGFEETHKRLAGCFVSIGQDGTPFIDKGLVKPEDRKTLARLLGEDAGETVKAKPKNALPESLRSDLAAYRLQVAQVEIAKQPDIALDLLAFTAASQLLASRKNEDGAQIEFKRPRVRQLDGGGTTPAAETLASLEQQLDTGWLKKPVGAERFEAFRQLPQAAKLSLLAYCVAMTLQPKLGPANGDEITAYDLALSLTQGSVADYWRPAKDSFLKRVNREQLLLLAGHALGEAWAQSRYSEKKAVLVDQLDRAFAEPERYGRTPEQVEALKSWLPAGMALPLPPSVTPAKAKKARKAA